MIQVITGVLANPIVIKRLEVLAVGIAIYGIEKLITTCIDNSAKRKAKQIVQN